MKKLTLSFLIILIAVTMIGCSSNNTKALTQLTSQLDNVAQIVSSTNTSEVADVSPSSFYNTSRTSLDNLQNYKILSYNNMIREDEIRHQVLALNAYIKSYSFDELKLTKNENKAILSLANDLKRYSLQLKNTKANVKNIVNEIKKNTKKTNELTESIESSYLTLYNIMNERFICLCNLYNDLTQTYQIVFKDYIVNDEKNDTSNITESDNNTTNFNPIVNEIEEVPEIKQSESTNNENSTQNKEKKKEERFFKKNIDSYSPYEKISENKQRLNNYINNNNYPINPNFNNQNYFSRPYIAPYNNFGYNAYNYNNPYSGNNFMFGRFNNGFNGFNGYNTFGYNGLTNGFQFNPTRNTDTFYPFNRNIDTYRLNPNIYNYGNYNDHNEIPVNAEVKYDDTATQDDNNIINEEILDDNKN